MPFTASLAEDRAKGNLALCRHEIWSGSWEKRSWEDRKGFCRACPIRFRGEQYCSLDFLTIGSLDQFKSEIHEIVSWIAKDNPTWTTLEGALPEADMAYNIAFNGNAPMPMKVIEDYAGFCVYKEKSQDFWRDWNRAVEYFDGKRVAPEDSKAMSGKVALGMIATASHRGPTLAHLYAAASVLEAAASYLSYRLTERVMGGLVEAGRKAIMATATLEVS